MKLRPARKLDPNYPSLDDVHMDPRLISYPGVLNPFLQFTSPTRQDMLSKQIVQALELHCGEHPAIFTGYETEMAKYDINPSERNEDIHVLAVVPRYHPVNHDGNIKFSPYKEVIYKGMTTGIIDYITIPQYFTGTNKFGHKKVIENQHYVMPGKVIPKDVVLCRSPINSDGEYRLGINANVAYMTHDAAAEDAILVRRGFAEKLKTTDLKEYVINISADQMPLNINGSESEYKLCADIGETVNDDGILMAFRHMSINTAASDTSPKQMARINSNDIKYCAARGGTIVDFDVHIGVPPDMISWQIFDQLKKYVTGTKMYWEQILMTYVQHKNNPISKKFNTKVTDAIKYLTITRSIPHGSGIPRMPQGKLPNFATRAGQPIEFIQIRIVVAHDRSINNAFKITDRHGSKGVVAKIVDDDIMPVDDYGIVADIVQEPQTAVKRMNMGTLLEPGINRPAEFVRRRIADEFEVNPETAWNTLVEFTHDVRPKAAESLIAYGKTPEIRYAWLKKIINERLYLHILPYSLYGDKLPPRKDMTDEEWEATVKSAKRIVKPLVEKWGGHPTPVTYKTVLKSGEKVTFRTRTNCWIGSKYIYLLSKLGETMSPGISRVSHFGTPLKPSSPFVKQQYPINAGPVRIIGEDENRNMTMDVEASEVLRLMTMMSGSLHGVQQMVKQIFISSHPTQINRIDISNQDLKRTSSPQALMRHIGSVIGINLSHTRVPEDKYPPWMSYSEAVEDDEPVTESALGESTDDEEEDTND